jgi:deoxyhypusine synthase
MLPIHSVQPVNDLPRLLEQMEMAGFQGKKLGTSLDVWSTMIQDEECTILLGLSGAMIPAGMQQCLIELVKHRFVDVIVSTGANIFHDICEYIGVRHYRGHHHVDDTELFAKGIDRIYDVFAYEQEFRDVDAQIAHYAGDLGTFRGSSRIFLHRFAEWLNTTHPGGKSLITTCLQNKVPIFVPALCDSSIGIGLLMARRQGIDIDIDQIADVDEITRIVEDTPKTGVIYVGGGVPKNFIQQTQVVASIHDKNCGGHDYAIQYTTDAPHWGGLSGCTFEEAISWGKESESTKAVQCFCDATIALPIITSALIGSGIRRTKVPTLL